MAFRRILHPPDFHTERNDWRFTVLFSNTAQAHQLERTRDWVVVYFHTRCGARRPADCRHPRVELGVK
jgi:hypothetical protein